MVGGILWIFTKIEELENAFKRVRGWFRKTDTTKLQYRHVEVPLATFSGNFNGLGTAEARICLDNPHDYTVRFRVVKLDTKMQGSASSLADHQRINYDIGPNRSDAWLNGNPIQVDFSSKLPMNGWIDYKVEYGRLWDDGSCNYSKCLCISGTLDCQVMSGRWESRFTPHEGAEQPIDLAPPVVSEDHHGLHGSYR